MRQFGTITPQFWTGETGKSLRGNAEVQVLATYLMTGPHAAATGVYFCPIMYMGHETGLGLEGASKALRRLIETGFCKYDETSECVFVLQMARFQIAEQLSAGDKRVEWVKRQTESMPKELKGEFMAVHAARFHLQPPSPIEGASEGALNGASKGHLSEKDIRTGLENRPDQTGKPNRKRKPPDNPLPADFALTPERAAYASKHLPGVSVEDLFELFCNQARKKAWTYADWHAAWQTYCRNCAPQSGHWSSGQYPRKSSGGTHAGVVMR